MRAYKFLDEKFGMKSLHEQRLKISTLEDLNDPFELLPYEMTDRNRRAALYATRKKIATNRGLLCFSVTWKDRPPEKSDGRFKSRLFRQVSAKARRHNAKDTGSQHGHRCRFRYRGDGERAEKRA